MPDVLKFPIVIMAGSDEGKSSREEILDYANVDYKALIKINNKTVIEYILEALSETNIITHYFIMGLSEELVKLPEKIRREKVTFIESKGKSMPERLQFAAKYMIKLSKTNANIFQHDSYHGLFMPGDIPFVKADMILRYVEKIKDLNYDFYPSAVSKELMTKRFPSSSRTYGKLREGYYCLGDISCFDYSLVEDRMDTIITIRNNRKKFMRVIIRVKPTVIIRYILKRLSFKNLDDATNKVLKLKTHFIRIDDPELAMDIDKPHQLDLARKELEKIK